ncbi:nitroreductase family protein [Paenibacillus thalictri]|uniref:Putative NAD(P)H nitroreductase n=1 Tax=Paenibacillus thalictri TaxID=2527873 RepID=A0A4Q9DIR6_9BACL|nr:nitroreductase [Paenibacillus thalictri]TBL73264.1 nitroreductase [Paenibacillus thalictri]
MNVHEAILGRRSIGRMTADPVDKKVIEKLLEAAVYAPNHRKTEPWRFIVMTGEGRSVLGKGYAEVERENAAGKMDEEQLKAHLEKQAAKAFRAPVVIAVAVEPSEGLGIERIEEFAAVHAAVQNMLLAAHELGLASIWRTGSPTYHPKMRAAFDLPETAELVGFVYLGHPVETSVPIPERTFAGKTVWLEA